MSIDHPSVDARGFVDDERYAAYKQSLLDKRESLEAQLLTPNADFARMKHLAGMIVALDYALGLPKVLLDSDPTSEPL